MKATINYVYRPSQAPYPFWAIATIPELSDTFRVEACGDSWPDCRQRVIEKLKALATQVDPPASETIDLR